MRLTIKKEPLKTVPGTNQSVVSKTALCSKNGISVRIEDELCDPLRECYFYVLLKHPWARVDGSDDFDEIVTDGDEFYIANKMVGKQRMVWTEETKNLVLESITKMVREL